MGERLARLPLQNGDRPALADFDYRQVLVIDTGKIRRWLGYSDILDEAQAMENLTRAAVDQARN